MSQLLSWDWWRGLTRKFVLFAGQTGLGILLLIGRAMRAARHPLRLLTVFCVLLTVLGATATTVWAQDDDRAQADYSDAIHVIQPKPVLQKKRFSLSPRLGMTVNDAVYRNFMVGANANYHLTERLYLGGIFQWFNFGDFLGGPTQAYRDVNSQTQALVDAPYLNWAAGAELGFVPLFGKFALFNRTVIFYDISLTAGATYADAATVGNPTSQSGVGGTASLSSRFFVNRWMALNLEVRDVVYFARVRNVADKVMSHSVTLGLGMSFYFPLGFEYSDDRSR